MVPDSVGPRDPIQFDPGQFHDASAAIIIIGSVGGGKTTPGNAIGNGGPEL